MIAARNDTAPKVGRRRYRTAACPLLLLLFIAPFLAAAAPPPTPSTVSVRPLDLSVAPPDDALSAAGQLGGALYPVDRETGGTTQTSGVAVASSRSTAKPTARRAAGNLAFGRAIQYWNAHDWKRAAALFRDQLTQFPDSPWVDEADLHLACEARYQGRYSEADERYQRILTRTQGNQSEGAQRLANKARMRLGESKTLRNNLEAAAGYFGDLEQNALDWRDRTYASHWLHRIAMQQADELAFLNCGYLALGNLLAARGEQAGAQAVLALKAQDSDGQSVQELKDLAAKYGLALSALRLSLPELDRVPLPAIVHIPGQSAGDKGHFWVLDAKRGELLKLHDPQSGRWFRQTTAEFSREWQGVALVFADGKSVLPGVPVTETELAQLTGGCCGVARPESDLGHPQTGCGECRWSVNPVNMNLFVGDTPLWYAPAVGPQVAIALSYNSQSALAQHEPFGNKWQFNYGTYLVDDPGDTVTIFMPDGRRDIYTGDAEGHYTPPADIHNRLTNLSGQRWELRFPDDSVFIYDIPAGTSSMQPFLVESRDVHGQKLTFGYNATVQLTTITDAMGQVTRMAYNSTGLVTSVTDPFNRTAGFQYDANRNLTQITDMGGYWSRLSYDANVYLTSIAKADGTWQFVIEPSTTAGNGSNAYPQPGGVMWANYRVTITNPAGAKTEWYYNGYSGYSWNVSPRQYVPWQSTDVNNFRSNVPKTKFTLDRNSSTQGRIASVSYPGQGQDSYQYDRQGNITKLTRPDGGIHQYAYNDQGLVTSVTDPKGQVTTLVYATNGVDLLSTTDGRGTIRYEYNGRHQVTRVTDRLGNKTALAYNDFGQLTQVTAAEGTAVQQITALTYDAARRLVQVTRAGQTVAQATYDTIGRIRTQTDAAGLVLTRDYDRLDQPTRVTYPDNGTEQFTWSTGRPFELTQETARGGKANRYTYDPEKRLTGHIAPDGALTRQLYDPDGNLSKLIDANGRPTAFTYDADNLVTAETYADGKGTTYTYDVAGRVKTRTNARGIRTDYTYDLNGNLTGINYADSTPDVAFVYDAYDRLIQRTDGLGVSRFTYDANDNLLSLDGPWDNDTITYTYDALGRRTGMSAQGGTPVAYTYDALGRLATVAQGSRTYSLSYQGNSNLLARLTRPNASYATYTNDTVQRLTALGNYKSDGTLLNRFQYSYNTDDQRSAETVTNGLPMVALTPGLETMQVNALNQVTSATTPARTYQYDADGNMTRGYTPAGFVWTASFDAEDRLASIGYTDGGGVLHRTEFAYLGNDLVGRTRKYDANVMTSETRQVRDGFLVVQERNGNNALSREYLWRDHGLGGIGRLLQIATNQENYDYLNDGRGNVAGLTDTSQQVAANYRYGPYGATQSSSKRLIQAMGFSTKPTAEDLGISDFGYRFYDLLAGRWVNRDPIGVAGGINVYSYTGDNPVNRVDPDGRYWWLVGAAVGGAGNLAYQLYQNGGKFGCVDWGNVGQYALIGAGLGALASMYAVPATVYHFTSMEAAAAIAESGAINAGSGIFGTGVYASSVNSGFAATLMGAASTETSIAIATRGLTIYPTLIPGAFRIIGGVAVRGILP